VTSEGISELSERDDFKGMIPLGIGGLSRFCFGFIAPKTLNYLSFQPFDFEHT